MELTISQDHLDVARKAAACPDALERYRAGMPVADVTQADLIWFAHHVQPDVLVNGQRIPVWALSASGYGDGYGSGYGYGYGDGSGYGYGSGYGDGEDAAAMAAGDAT